MRTVLSRIAKLEDRFTPAAEPVIVEVIYVSPDGTEELGYRVELPTSTGPSWRWRMQEQQSQRGVDLTR